LSSVMILFCTTCLTSWSWLTSHVDQSGIVYNPKTYRNCCKNRTFTAANNVNMVRFRSVLSGAEIRSVLYPYRKRVVYYYKRIFVYEKYWFSVKSHFFDQFIADYGPFRSTWVERHLLEYLLISVRFVLSNILE
jgi:hypothetical protein